MTTSFDRLRPRTGGQSVGSPLHDAEGKRALFSTTPAERPPTPAVGAVTIECNRCGTERLLSPLAGLRALFPSLTLSVRFRTGDGLTRLGVGRGALVRCPTCSRPTWSNVTIQV